MIIPTERIICPTRHCAHARLVFVLAVLVVAPGTSHGDSGPVALEAGAGRTWLATPEKRAEDSNFSALVGLSFGVQARREVQVGVRGDVVLGRSFVSAIGPFVRYVNGRLVFRAGLGLAHVTGAKSMYGSQPEGTGLSFGVAAGLALGAVGLHVHALPVIVFASDSTQYDAHLNGAFEVGLSVSLAL